MNQEKLGERIVLLQQSIDIHAQQVKSLSDNLIVLRGHLAESQYWLTQCPKNIEEIQGENQNAIEEGIEPESDIIEHQDGDCSGETEESSGCDSSNQSAEEQQKG